MVCYGSVTWTLTQLTEEMLCRCERKVLSRMYGPVKDNGLWCPRWNIGIYDFYNIYDI